VVIVRSDSSVLSIARQILLRALSIVEVLEGRRAHAAESMREVVDAQRTIATDRPSPMRETPTTDAAPTGWVN
jgi:hypothetical protein